MCSSCGVSGIRQLPSMDVKQLRLLNVPGGTHLCITRMQSCMLTQGLLEMMGDAADRDVFA